MRQTRHVLDVLGLHDDPLLKMALELEKIARPRQFYTGPQRREFVPISGR